MTDKPCVYLIGSLRNPRIPYIGNIIRGLGYEAFDEWHAAGPEADDKWQAYEKERGRSHRDALYGHAAQNVFHFDLRNLQRSAAAVLVMPAGKSGHLELGYMVGTGRPGFILFEQEPERYDVMHAFATLNGGGIFYKIEDLLPALQRVVGKPKPVEGYPLSTEATERLKLNKR